MNPKLPNFLIVGAPKSGTTSLHYYLQQHPEVYMPTRLKESLFFVQPKSLLGKKPSSLNFPLIETIEEYQGLFADFNLPQHRAAGEACPIYLYFHSVTIPLIKQYLGDPKIIIILRNPVTRAFSNHLHHIRDHLDDASFQEALELEEKRIEQNWWYSFHLKQIGWYSQQVKAFLNSFSQVRIFLFDDFIRDPLDLTQTIFSFLGVDSSFVPEMGKFNTSGIPRSRKLHRFLSQPPKVIKNYLKPAVTKALPEGTIRQFVQKTKQANLQKPTLDPTVHQSLLQFYEQDLNRLEKLIQKDLSIWRK